MSGAAQAADNGRSTPLAPGKPSGVHDAQGFAFNYPVIFTGIALGVVVGGYFLATHNIDRGTSTSSTAGTSP